MVAMPAAATDRPRARKLLRALTEFSACADALSQLFAGLAEDSSADSERRLELTAQVLRWQNPPASQSLAVVLEDVDGDTATEGDGAVTNDMMLLAMGKPALLFATSIYDDSLAEDVWAGFLALHRRFPAFNLAKQALDNSWDSHGYSALHYAIEAQMDDLVVRIWSDLAQGPKPSELAEVASKVVTRDVALPVGKAQVQGRNIASGGASLLHFAAKCGSIDIVHALLAPPLALPADGRDWDGNSAYIVAHLSKHRQVADELRAATNELEVDDATLEKIRVDRDDTAKSRFLTNLEPLSAATTKPAVFPRVWSIDECELVLSALERITKADGWFKQRHASYPTTDMPSFHVVELDGWVRASLADRLFPQIETHYELPPSQHLTFRELFFVKYEARAGEQGELALHCDGSALSFNVLLNPAEEFTGGGTFFEATKQTVHITQGDAAVHSGKVRHAGAPVLSGRRLILVGFLDLVDNLDL